MSGAGLIVALLGFLYGAWVFAARLIRGTPVLGWNSLMCAVLFTGGMQMLMLGMIGEYLWRTLAQVRRRDLYVVEQIYD